MEVTCQKCKSVSDIPDRKIPIGRSYTICPVCQSRINIFKGLPVGAIIQNLIGMRMLRDGDEFCEQYIEPGEFWRVVDVIAPCPDKGHGRACEIENQGRCPNQRLIVRLRRDRTRYRTCLYRRRRRIFDRADHTAVGVQQPTAELFPVDEEETYRIR